MSFALRLAPHISFGGLEKPLFKSLVGSDDPIVHIQWAADQGFAGIQDPLAVLRSPSAQQQIGTALERRDLQGGCFIYAPPPKWGLLWTSQAPDDRQTLADQVADAIETAKRIGSRHIAVLVPLDPGLGFDQQRVRLVENLQRLAPQVGRAGMFLCLEAVNSRRVPGMLLNHVLDAHATVLAVDHPACRLIFDYGHVQAMDGDILFHLNQVWREVEVIQIADNPGRGEPGSGELNFRRLFVDLAERKWGGLCELEHGWAHESAEAAQAYLDRLRNWCGQAILADV